MVITGLFESGLENLIEDKIAFINFDEIFIHSEAVELIKPNRMIVEMLENSDQKMNMIQLKKESLFKLNGRGDSFLITESGSQQCQQIINFK